MSLPVTLSLKKIPGTRQCRCTFFSTFRLSLSHCQSCHRDGSILHHPTQPNPTQPTMLSQGPNPTNPPLHNNPRKGDIFQLNVENSKIPNRPRSYIGHNMLPTNNYKTVQSHNHSHNSPARSPQRTISMASTLEAANPLSLSNPTQPMDGPNPCSYLHCHGDQAICRHQC